MFPIGSSFKNILFTRGFPMYGMVRSTSTLFSSLHAVGRHSSGMNSARPALRFSFSSSRRDDEPLRGEDNPFINCTESGLQALYEKIALNDVSAMKRVEKPVTLKDGTRARISVLGIRDAQEVGRFYASLSPGTMSVIASSSCAYRHRGKDASDYQAATFRSALTSDVVLGIKVCDKEGKEMLAAITFYLRPGSGEKDGLCLPYGTVAADAFQGKGMGVELKKAQIECARLDGMGAMFNKNLNENTVKIWRKAAAELGLRFTETKRDTWYGTEWNYRIDLRDPDLRH
jgi:hypothetical protein